MEEHAQSKLSTWIVVLLGWVIVLLMFGIGYMVYTNKQPAPETEMSATALASACADVVQQALDAQPVVEPVTCPTKETYDGYGDVTFDYPIDWEVFAQSIETAKITIIRLSEDPLWLCDGCDGPGNALGITIAENTGAKVLDTVVAEKYTTANGYTNVTKTPSTFGGKTAMVVKADFSGLGSGKVEEILYVTPTKIITAWNHNFENDAAVEEAWTMLKVSLTLPAAQ